MKPIDAVIRARCPAEADCYWPECACIQPQGIRAARDLILAETPEIVEVMAQVILLNRRDVNPINPPIYPQDWSISERIESQSQAVAVLAALRQNFAG